MVVKKGLSLAFLIVASIVFMKLPAGSSADLPIVTLDPPITHVDVGESFFVNIAVTNVLRLYSWQIFIEFDPAVLQFVNATEGDFLSASAPEGTWTVAPAIDNTAGNALFGWAIQGGYIGPSGSGWLGSMEWTVSAAGESVLNITNSLTKLIEYRAPPPPPGETVMKLIPHARENGFFTNLVAPPHAEFSFAPAVPGVGQEITFNASASYAVAPQTVTQLEWDFGDNVTQVFARDVNLTYTTTHTYSEAGIYDVSLIVFDDTPASELVQSMFGTTEMPRLWYELLSKYEVTITLGLSHDIAVTEVKVSKDRVTAGETVYVDVKVLNKGVETETFGVEAYYGANLIEKKPVSNLAPAASFSLQFNWDTSNVPSGVYTVKAVAVDVVGEAYLPDNTKIDGTVEVVSSTTEFPIMIIAAAAIVVVVVIVVAVFLLRRRKGA